MLKFTPMVVVVAEDTARIMEHSMTNRISTLRISPTHRLTGSRLLHKRPIPSMGTGRQRILVHIHLTHLEVGTTRMDLAEGSQAHEEVHPIRSVVVVALDTLSVAEEGHEVHSEVEGVARLLPFNRKVLTGFSSVLTVIQ